MAPPFPSRYSPSCRSQEWKMENFSVELYADVLNVTDVQVGVTLTAQVNGDGPWYVGAEPGVL